MQAVPILPSTGGALATPVAPPQAGSVPAVAIDAVVDFGSLVLIETLPTSPIQPKAAEAEGTDPGGVGSESTGCVPPLPWMVPLPAAPLVPESVVQMGSEPPAPLPVDLAPAPPAPRAATTPTSFQPEVCDPPLQVRGGLPGEPPRLFPAAQVARVDAAPPPIPPTEPHSPISSDPSPTLAGAESSMVPEAKPEGHGGSPHDVPRPGTVGLGLAADRAAPPRVPAVTMSLADVPEPLLCTLEYETSPRVGPAITSVQVTPPAPRGDLSLLAAGAPLRDLTLLLDDPEGPVKVTVGREQREVSVQVEVPTGLLVAVREAQAPIRTALGQQGLELGRYEVLADAPGQGGDRAPAEDQGSTQERENRAGRRGVRAGRNSGSPCAPAGGRRRLLDVRARRRPWRSTTWGLGR